MAFGMKVASLFNEKVKKGVEKRFPEQCSTAFAKDDKVIWMHAASLGEYEQGFLFLKS
jgi:3-deoxy-D-manno-octulosonic-acid transferase